MKYTGVYHKSLNVSLRLKLNCIPFAKSCMYTVLSCQVQTASWPWVFWSITKTCKLQDLFSIWSPSILWYDYITHVLTERWTRRLDTCANNTIGCRSRLRMVVCHGHVIVIDYQRRQGLQLTRLHLDRSLVGRWHRTLTFHCSMLLNCHRLFQCLTSSRFLWRLGLGGRLWGFGIAFGFFGWGFWWGLCRGFLGVLLFQFQF